jgi:branched-chain amino acid transport system substrate-binding protein
VLTACGTRLPNSAFVASGSSGGGSSSVASGQTGGSDNTTAGSSNPSGSGSIATNSSTGPSIGNNGTGPSSTGTTGPSTTSSTGPSTTKSTAPTGSGGSKNTASDRGVTPTTINVCNIVTEGGPFGPYQFTPSYYGAAAYFQYLNANGGVNGRQVVFTSHPDDGSDAGDLDQVKTCINQNKAFAFVANDIYQYGGASLVNSMDIPDIGSQPISTAYDLYPHLYEIDGDHQPRDGKTLGLGGYGYRTDEQALFFKNNQHITHVGVVYYDQASSQYGASEIAQGFEAAGVKVTMEQVNLGLPNFASAVADMKSKGVDLVADAVDLNGSQKLCQSIEQNSAFLNQMKIKLSTISDWTQSLGSDLEGTPACANKSWSDAYSLNFDDTSNAQVAIFQNSMHKYFPTDIPHNHQFALEGWIGAMWFTDAVRSCGATVTRTCVEKFMNRQTDYTARGLLEPNVGFQLFPASYYNSSHRYCVSAAQWSMSAKKWITKATPTANCYNAGGYKYTLTPPT